MLTVGDTRSIGEITLSAIYLEGATLTNWISNQCSITLRFNVLPMRGWENHAELMDYHLIRLCFPFCIFHHTIIKLYNVCVHLPTRMSMKPETFINSYH